MSFSDYGSVAYELPDRPLIVKCTFDRSMKRITFSSASNCKYDILRLKLEQSFSLSATSFTVAYKDDDGEITAITNDFDLIEAIQYFQVGDDSASSSAASIASGRSGNGRRITLRVYITVEYDGPSLSDTSSLASMDDFPRAKNWGHEYQGSISLSDGGSSVGYGYTNAEPEDDAVTISSRDNSISRPIAPSVTTSQRPLPHLPPNYRLPSHSVPSIATSPPSPPLSDASQPLPAQRRINSSSSQNFTVIHGSERSTEGSYDLISQPSVPSISRRDDSPSPPPVPPKSNEQIQAKSKLLFDQLKYAEQSGDTSPYSMPSSLAHSERGARWLQDQNARVMRTFIGEVAESTSGASSTFDDGIISMSDGDIRGDLALEKNPRGRYYYTYKDGFDSTEYSLRPDSCDMSEAPTSPVIASESGALARPLSHHLAWLANQQRPPTTSSGSPSSDSRLMNSGFRPLASSSSQQPLLPRQPSTQLTRDSRVQVGGISISPEPTIYSSSHLETVSAPQEVTECSACSTGLDYFRYICSVCGEKEVKKKGIDIPVSPSSSWKGKERAALPEDTYLSVGYPPTRHSPASPSSLTSPWVLLGDRDHGLSSPLSTISSFLKGRHRGIRKSASRSSVKTTGSGASATLTNSQSTDSTVHLLADHRYPSPQLLEKGYELCSECIYTAGVTHAHEKSIAGVPTSPTVPGSPASSPEETERYLRSNAARRLKTRWHAFIEKVWNGKGWTTIEQDDNASCSICSSTLTSGRYKCASCNQFNLCRACFSQVHEIHPSHAFLVVPVKVPEKPQPPRPPPTEEPPNQGEQSLLHPGVTCYHCQLAIVGARFHCAICESVDICQNCEAAGLPGNLTTTTDGGHDASHVMIKIPYPLESAEVAFASRRARVLWSERDAATIEAINNRITPRSRSNSVDSTHAATVIASRRKYSSNPMDHQVPCDACDKNIVGVRYQCAHCPSSPAAYNLCSECEKISYIVHRKDHVFLKFNRRVDHLIAKPQALLPTLYENFTDSQDIQLPEDLQDLVHSQTYCDRCMLPIRGAWFRCLYCNQDMCDEHEQLHQQDHVCMVFKAKVDLLQLRLITDIENPSQSAAIIPKVYNSV